MMRHRKAPSFIQYELPEGKPKPRPVTTMMLGEEGGSPRFTDAEGGFPPISQLPPHVRLTGTAKHAACRVRTQGLRVEDNTPKQ